MIDTSLPQLGRPETLPPRLDQTLLQLTTFLLECILVTGRNEAVAKVIFLHLFVILFTQGGCLPQCMLGYHTSREQTPPRSRAPRADTPQSRHPPEKTPPEQTPPWEQNPPPGAESPRSRIPQEQTPPGADTIPWKQTPAYGQ